MIVVDTSALMAILKNEPPADACQRRLEEEEEVLISAGTLAEACIVAGQKGLSELLHALLKAADTQCVTLTEADASAAGDAYARWGKSNHRAKLNYGDCFAYVLARSRSCPLLYVGDDFARTDIVSAL